MRRLRIFKQSIEKQYSKTITLSSGLNLCKITIINLMSYILMFPTTLLLLSHKRQFLSEVSSFSIISFPIEKTFLALWLLWVISLQILKKLNRGLLQQLTLKHCFLPIKTDMVWSMKYRQQLENAQSRFFNRIYYLFQIPFLAFFGKL